MTLNSIAQAYKRGRKFGIEHSGPFTPVRSRDGMCIAASNACYFLDARGDDTDEFVTDLVLLDRWAESIERASKLIMFNDDENAQIALGAFVSRCPIDPTI